MSITNTKPSNDYPGKLIYSGYSKKGYVENLSLDAGTYWFLVNTTLTGSVPRIASPANFTRSALGTYQLPISNVICFLANETNGALYTDMVTLTQPSGNSGFINVNCPLVQTNDYLYAGFDFNTTYGSPYLMRTSDGVNWTAIDNPPTVALSNFANSHKTFVYNADVTNKFVYCAKTDSRFTAVWTSTDGLTWTSRTLPVNVQNASGPSSVVINANATNKYCINISGQSNMIMYSTDAVTWTQATVATGTQNLFGPVATNNTASTNEIYIYAVNVTTNNIITSTDGVTWTSRSTGRAGLVTALIWFNNYYIALAASGSTAYEYSTDGITWSNGTIASPYSSGNQILPFIFDNELYISSFNSGGYNISTDGITWSSREMGGFAQFYKIGDAYINVVNGSRFDYRPSLYYRIYRLDDAPALP